MQLVNFMFKGWHQWKPIFQQFNDNQSFNIFQHTYLPFNKNPPQCLKYLKYVLFVLSSIVSKRFKMCSLCFTFWYGSTSRSPTCLISYVKRTKRNLCTHQPVFPMHQYAVYLASHMPYWHAYRMHQVTRRSYAPNHVGHMQMGNMHTRC